MEGVEYTIPAGIDLKATAEKNMWSNIKWRALFCLIEHNGSMPISEMSNRLSLSAKDTIQALEEMELLGLIQKDKNGYAQKTTNYSRSPIDRRVADEIISDFILSNDQVTNRLIEMRDSERHKTRSVIYNSNQALVDELYKNIDLAIQQFKEKSDVLQKYDGVFALSCAIVDVVGELK